MATEKQIIQGFQNLVTGIYYRIVRFVSFVWHVMSLICLYAKLAGDISADEKEFFRKKTLENGHFWTESVKCHVFK